jgi:hypothetical protein
VSDFVETSETLILRGVFLFTYANNGFFVCSKEGLGQHPHEILVMPYRTPPEILRPIPLRAWGYYYPNSIAAGKMHTTSTCFSNVYLLLKNIPFC